MNERNREYDGSDWAAGALPVPPDDVRATLSGADRVVIVGHVTPDADCLCSCLGLAEGLRGLGIKAGYLVPPESIARRVAFFLEGRESLLATAGDLHDATVVAVLDTALRKRCNLPEGATIDNHEHIVNIDHHTSNEQFGSSNWVDEHAASTCQMVYLLLTSLGMRVDESLATMLYAGVHSDTVGFSLNSSTPATLEVASRLAAAGARIGDVCHRMNRSLTRSDFELLRVIYRNTRCSPCGRVAYSTADHDEITSAGCTAADIDDQVSVPRSIQGAQVAMLFTEAVPGKIRVNLRGEGPVHVLPIAQQFGGGGHSQSAGVIVPGTIEQVVARVTSAAVQHLDAHHPQ